MVDDRRAAVLRAVVQQYIETSQPVSSSSVMDSKGINASSATVRGEMAALERDGFLQQPHTSAGRIPTDLGYRFFVDQIQETQDLDASQQQDIRGFFDKASGEIEHMLDETGRLLSNLTGAASVVVAPDHDTATVRSAQLVPLAERVALAVLVLSNGTVEKCSIDMPAGITDEEVSEASKRLAEHLTGLSVSAMNAEAMVTDRSPVSALAKHAVDALRTNHETDVSDHVYVGGASNLAQAFDAVEVVRNVLTILEQQFVVVSLMRDLLDRGVTVAIGNESGVQPLSQCSVVVAPTFVDGEARGSVAVLGPTRMNYSQAMAAVAMVSSNLGERLGTARQ